MAITSNYKITISPLQSTDVGVIPKKETVTHHSPWLSILGWVATIAEVGITFLLPETAPVWASLAVATTGAGIQTGIMAASGELNAIGLGINWGASLIPFGSQAAKLASKEIKTTKLMDFFNAAATEELQVTKATVKDWVNTGYAAEAFSKVEKNIGKNVLGYDYFAQGLSEWSVEGRIYDMLSKAEKQAEEWLRFSKSEIETMSKAGVDFSKIAEQAQNFEETIAESIRSRISNFISAPTAESIAAEATEEAAQQFTGADAKEIRALLQKVFGKDVDELYELLKSTPKHAQQSIIKGWILEKLGQENANALLQRINEIFDTPRKAVFAARKSVKNNSEFSKAVKWAGTRDFDERVVQRIQALFDASDFGRKWIEDSYKFLKKKLRKTFSRTAKALDKLQDLEQAYVKSGGQLVAGSEIIGYKTLKVVGPRALIMINFNPAKWDMGGTAAKNMFWKGRLTKNYGGKKPVFVWAYVNQLPLFVNGGMEYYLDTWAYSRGGAVVGTNLFNNIFHGMDVVVLPFVKTGLLRNLLSLTSNIVENSYDMVTGDWFSKTIGKKHPKTITWWDRAFRSFKRTGVSRVGRLFAQGIVRPLIGGRAGYYIGREVQRVLGATSTAINNNQLEGKSTFGKQFFASYKGKFMGGVISYANAPGRRTGRYSANKRTAQRKLGFLRRPISAVTPDAIFSPRSFGRIKL